MLGEIVLGKVRLFVNAENLLGVRQTKYDPLVRPVRAPDGRWTVDAWAPDRGVRRQRRRPPELRRRRVMARN
jgi:iron complex outermembrane receptor protein